ncbi:MAG TPA: hypothetical protein VGK32_11980 [Vicinamibacterales bacterium]
MARVLAWPATHPYALLSLLGGVCLLAFLATIPLPRIDGQLVGSDGAGYYSYLPAVVLDGRLDLSAEFQKLHVVGIKATSWRTATGRQPNPWPIGAALLWIPFFLIAHAAVLVANGAGAGLSSDGCSNFHQAVVISGNILYGLVAILVTFRVASRFSTRAAAVWATALVLCGGNLVYYMTAEASMAHPTSAFATSLFFLAWIELRGRPGPRRAIVYGLIGGLLALVRTQEAVFLALPFIVELPALGRRLFSRTTREPGRTRLTALGQFAGEAAISLCVALVIFSPQVWVSHYIYGMWTPAQLYIGAAGGSPFTWTAPHLTAVLVSAHRGLFTWHPVFLLGVIGLALLWRRDRRAAALCLLAVTTQVYILGAWYDWHQGDAFGGRAFIGCTTAFATGLAVLLDATLGTARWRRGKAWLAAAVTCLIVVANFLLFVEYRFDLVNARRTVTWQDLGTRRLTYFLDKIGSGTRPDQTPGSR